MDVLKELVLLADSLDKKGLNKEADYLDELVSKYAAKKKEEKKNPFAKKEDKKEEKKNPFAKKEDKKEEKKEDKKEEKKNPFAKKEDKKDNKKS